MELDTSVARNEIADALLEYFCNQDENGVIVNTGNLPDKLEEFFGLRLLKYRPIDPRKAVRDAIKHLDDSEILRFASWVSAAEPELEGWLNRLLGSMNVMLREGEVVTS